MCVRARVSVEFLAKGGVGHASELPPSPLCCMFPLRYRMPSRLAFRKMPMPRFFVICLCYTSLDLGY